LREEAVHKNWRVAFSLVCFAALFAAAFYLANYGRYGWTLFVMLPVLAGGLGTWSMQPVTWGRAVRTGAIVGSMGCLLFLVVGKEGFFCVLMALPIVVPLTILGSLLAYWGGGLSNPKQPAAMCLLLPISMLFDVNARPPVYSVTTSIVVNAPPERVWKNVVAFPDISAQPDWVLSTGLAYPIRTRIEGSGFDAPRKCDLSTGTVEERVVVWDEPRLLRFVVTSTPPAMMEMGLYGPIYPKHVTGYYESAEGQFTLTALPDGRTLVAGTSWYRHGLWPAQYWRLWSDMVVHHIHRRVLEHIRQLSEANG
jgi:Polyketide cyclase / dehydrase and lipid transport